MRAIRVVVRRAKDRREPRPAPALAGVWGLVKGLASYFTFDVGGSSAGVGRAGPGARTARGSYPDDRTHLAQPNDLHMLMPRTPTMDANPRGRSAAPHARVTTLHARTERRYLANLERFPERDAGCLREAMRNVERYPLRDDETMAIWAAASHAGNTRAHQLLTLHGQQVALDVALTCRSETVSLAETLSEANDAVSELAPRIRSGKWSYQAMLRMRVKKAVMHSLRRWEMHGITFDCAADRRAFWGTVSLRRAAKLERRGKLVLAADAIVLPSPYETAEGGDRTAWIEEALSSLPQRDARIVRLTYGIGGEQIELEEIGRRLGITRERTRQILQRALHRLESALCRPRCTPQRPKRTWKEILEGRPGIPCATRSTGISDESRGMAEGPAPKGGPADLASVSAA